MDEKKVIVGFCSNAEDLYRATEYISQILNEAAEQLHAIFEQIGEAMSNAFNTGFQGFSTSTEDDTGAQNPGTPPKKYGMTLRKPLSRLTKHYNYIPRTARNLPYQKRVY